MPKRTYFPRYFDPYAIKVYAEAVELIEDTGIAYEGRYFSNVMSDLKNMGEHELVRDFWHIVETIDEDDQNSPMARYEAFNDELKRLIGFGKPNGKHWVDAFERVFPNGTYGAFKKYNGDVSVAVSNFLHELDSLKRS